MTLKTRNLYKRSLEEKWKHPMGNVAFFSHCPFCKDVIVRDDSCSVSLDGDECGELCLIDKEICGHVDSILSNIDTYINAKDLRDYTYGSFTLKDEALTDKILIGMFKSIQKLMKKHSKINLRFKS
jgi:hypothetical protein